MRDWYPPSVMASSFIDCRDEPDAASALDLLRKVETVKMIDANAIEDRATAGITAAVFDMFVLIC